jgi:serine/threonine-protein kinase
VERVQVLGGRYRLVERLGTGGMSVVWRAYDEVLGRPVAVKMLAPKLAADPASRARIRVEARAAARLSHPHITNVYDYGESIVDDGPGRAERSRAGTWAGSARQRSTVPFVVMELVDGYALDTALAGGPLPWLRAVEVCAQVASALAAVHARGLVHRDIKPANVMLTPGGAKLVDFGISAVAGEHTDFGGELLGTPAYLAPERLDGAPTAPSTDVYALGLVLYRTLAGQLPWRAEGTTEMLRAHCWVPPTPLPRLDGLPREVAEVCFRCLSKLPAGRPTAAEVARVLAGAAGRVATRTLVRMPTRARLRLGRTTAGGVGLAASLLVLSTCAGTGSGSGTGAGASERHEERSNVLVRAPTEGDRVAEPRLGCVVRYAARTDGTGEFTAQLTVTNTGAAELAGWRLAFRLPGDQQVRRVTPGTWHQDGAAVTVSGGSARLAPDATARLAVAGSYQGANPMPASFVLNGMTCQLFPALPAATIAAAGGVRIYGVV